MLGGLSIGSTPDTTIAERHSAKTAQRMNALQWLFTGITLGGFGIFALIALIDPAHFEHLARKDAHGDTGLIEHLTVLSLLPAIVLAAVALVCWRGRLPSRWIGAWLVLWILACTYFAGEEASWGQWLVGFDTPDWMAEANDQGETNLHNMSTWLDQKPRMMVKLFIIVGGLILPVSIRWRQPVARAATEPARTRWLDEHQHWLIAPAMCWAAAAIVLTQRIASWIDLPFFQRIGTSEFRELGIAWFLSLYLLSYFLRLRLGPPRAIDRG